VKQVFCESVEVEELLSVWMFVVHNALVPSDLYNHGIADVKTMMMIGKIADMTRILCFLTYGRFFALLWVCTRQNCSHESLKLRVGSPVETDGSPCWNR